MLYSVNQLIDRLWLRLIGGLCIAICWHHSSP